MSELIQWPRAKYWDKAWNPIIGCKPCSPACKNCYAAAWAKRFGKSFEPHFTAQKNKPPHSGVVFCGNMTDLFGEWVLHPEDAIDLTIQEFPKCLAKDTIYLWLSKRTAAMYRTQIRIAGRYSFGAMEQHLFGMTAENQRYYDRRIKDFRASYFQRGWLSCEPLLGPIELGLRTIAPEDQPFQWVVVGCESGPKRRPCKIEWVENIVAQCLGANVPVFVKQLDFGGKCVTDINKFPKHLQIRQVPWANEFKSAGQRPGLVGCASTPPAGGARNSASNKPKE